MTAVDAVADALREDILDGRLGADEPLRETALTARFGVNRHTVRAALQALAAERLVTFEAYRGARVRSFSDADVFALMEYRTAIEAEAVRLLRTRAEPSSPPPASIIAANDSLRRICIDRPGDHRAIEVAHAELHHTIVAAARSPRLSEAHAGLLAELGLFMVQLRSVLPPEELIDQHDRLIHALSGDQGEAELRAHLAHSAEQLIALRRSTP
ncbi:GntR family transcriptional regulator [Plantibacter sp. ME-Dv--P-122b]|uniref:GntR family transcriptional regulator n=1 Tax=Plantibacter sp. ME-Dv--P-122b TaxID=3040300 RepID=UPI00254A924B|nr:GntR family transcriptional regulator [Plantibacter sp. ME-Dv--P-122b]